MLKTVQSQRGVSNVLWKSGYREDGGAVAKSFDCLGTTKKNLETAK